MSTQANQRGTGMDRREFLRRSTVAAAACGGALAAPSASGQDAADKRRPNIVYILSDQQHWKALGAVDSYYETPHLDALAEDAALFERAFCTTPQCSPSRSSMWTGRYPTKTGVMGNMNAAGGNPLDQETIGRMLHEVGYETAYFGKWHLGDALHGEGWDRWETKGGDRTALDDSLAFLGERGASDRPFFLVSSFIDPHDIYDFQPDRDRATDPRTVLPRSWREEDFATKPSVHLEFMERDQGTKIHGRPEEVWRAYREFYREKVRLYDEYVGKILAAIREAGAWDDTIILVGSDHGDMDAHHRLIFKGPFMYDEMVRVPFLARVPEKFGGTMNGRRVADHDTVNVDLVPTIRDFAGLESIETDGLSLKPLLTGADTVPTRDYVIGQYYSKQRWVNPIRMIRTADWKFNRYLDHGEELYDLRNDPGEIVNLATDGAYAARKKELSDELDRWIAANNDPFRSLRTVPLKKG